jgi:hypothetical protein
MPASIRRYRFSLSFGGGYPSLDSPFACARVPLSLQGRGGMNIYYIIALIVALALLSPLIVRVFKHQRREYRKHRDELNDALNEFGKDFDNMPPHEQKEVLRSIGGLFDNKKPLADRLASLIPDDEKPPESKPKKRGIHISIDDDDDDK